MHLIQVIILITLVTHRKAVHVSLMQLKKKIPVPHSYLASSYPTATTIKLQAAPVDSEMCACVAYLVGVC